MMYKAAIVDDDVMVLSFLQKMIQWEAHGFTLQHVFQDSVAAAERLAAEPVDLLITDIGMPRMNGIELIRHVREQQGETNSVILSCHDEFHFAQQALKLGTLDYLLKETMDVEPIEELLDRVKNRFDEQPPRAVSLQEEAGLYFGTDPEAGRLFAYVFPEHEASWEQVPVIQSTLPKTTRVYVHDEAYFLDISKEHEFVVQNSWARNGAVLWSDDRSKVMAHKEQRFYLTKGDCAPVKEAPFRETDWFSWYDDCIQQVEQALLQDDEDALKRWGEEAFSRLREKQPHPDTARSWAVKLTVDLQMKISCLYGNGRDDVMVDPHLKQAPTAESLQDALLSALESLRLAVHSCLDVPIHSDITKAQKYVRLHIDQKIGLQEVADYLHLNASYFSRLYKQHTGETFIAYVTKEKMNRARELLDQTERTVEEIADLLGYEHKSYFVKTFKKQYGIPPREYRSRLLAN